MPNLENNPTHNGTISEKEGKEKEGKRPKFSDEKLESESNQLLAKLASLISDYKQREGQKHMIKALSDAFNADKTLVVEAGTGTGKTFSYLVGALPFILHCDKKLIVSTHTVSLQTQLIKKDLPLINAIVNNVLKIEIAKGGDHYFCPKLAYEAIRNTNKGMAVEIGNSKRRIKNVELKEIESLLITFNDESFDGDLDSLIAEQTKAIIPFVQRRRDRCPRKSLCSFGEACPYYIQQKKLPSADIIVTNHALLSLLCRNDLQIFGSIEDQLLVVDEAHHFPKVFRDQSEVCIELNSKDLPDKKIIDFISMIDKLLKKNKPSNYTQTEDELARKYFTKSKELSIELSEKLVELDQFLIHNFSKLRGDKENKFDDENLWRLEFEFAPDALFSFIEDTYKINSALLNTIDNIQTKIITPLVKDEAFKEDKDSFSNIEMAYKKIISELLNIDLCSKNYLKHNEIELLCDRVDAGYVRWITATPNTDGSKNFKVYSNRCDITADIKSSIFDVFSSSIFTSATIQALGSFNEFFIKMGIDKLKNASSLVVKSPFDYTKVDFSTPVLNGDPNSEAYSKIIVEQIQLSAQRHQAILVLFNSYAQMESVYKQCPTYLQNIIKLQKKQARGELVSHHCEQIDEGKASILLGVDSLAEGVDLKGKYLTCVMIAKFPFPSLNHPMLSYEAKQIEFYNRSSFMELSLPLCSRKLIQCVGRLIRSENDYGEVILLDSRANTKKYGKQLIQSLPFFNYS